MHDSPRERGQINTRAKNKVEAVLSAGDKRTVRGVVEAVQLVVEDKATAQDLLILSANPDEAVAMRAADALEKLSRISPRYLKPIRAKLLDLPRHSNQQEVLWHWCQVMPRLEWNARQVDHVARQLQALTKEDSRILRTMAYQGPVNVAKTYPTYLSAAKSAVKKAAKDPAKAVQARARLFMKELELAESWSTSPKDPLHRQIASCKACKDLPLGPKPIVRLHRQSKVVVVGQAPGIRVHETGIPWNDPSGEKLREWLDVSRLTFYDPRQFALVPMGFCYPGTGKGGDLPPRSLCAKLWRQKLEGYFTKAQVTLVLGTFAMDYYLPGKGSLTERIKGWRQNFPRLVPMPHPSPRNNRWLKENPWFERELVPELQQLIKSLCKSNP